jgi:hypothetical protein
VPWLALAGGCVVIAAVYAVVWPRPKGGAARPPWRHLLLRWGHSAVWALLAVSFLARTAGDTATAAANTLAIAALALYAAFLVVAFLDRSPRS